MTIDDHHKKIKSIEKEIADANKKKPYAKIYYSNLGHDYGFTICPLDCINDNVECFKQDVEDVDEQGFEAWTEKQQLPEVKITLVMLSDSEFEKWFIKNVESKA